MDITRMITIFIAVALVVAGLRNASEARHPNPRPSTIHTQEDR
jgi:hypothetical protein